MEKINNKYPSDRFKNRVRFVVYTHQKYFKGNNNYDPSCPYCSEKMTLIINHNILEGNNLFWKCISSPGCKGTVPFSLSIIDEVQYRSRQGESYGFCSCEYDRRNAITDNTPTELLKEFVAVFYWLLCMDQNLYSLLVDGRNMNIVPNKDLYSHCYKVFQFPKLFAHGAWGTHHMEPIFLFKRIKPVKFNNTDKHSNNILPSKTEIVRIKDEIWNEVMEFINNTGGYNEFEISTLRRELDNNLFDDLEEALKKI